MWPLQPRVVKGRENKSKEAILLRAEHGNSFKEEQCVEKQLPTQDHRTQTVFRDLSTVLAAGEGTLKMVICQLHGQWSTSQGCTSWSIGSKRLLTYGHHRVAPECSGCPTSRKAETAATVFWVVHMGCSTATQKKRQRVCHQLCELKTLCRVEWRG